MARFKLHNSNESPENIDYDIFGLHKKRTIVKGELLCTEYYREYDGTNYSDLIVKEERAYNRDALGLVQTRVQTVTWYLYDGKVGCVKKTTKYYSPQESIEEGVSRRDNVISEAKIYCLGALGQAYAFDLLTGLKPYIAIYLDGYKQPLIDSVNASTKPYLTPAMKTIITSILTF